MNKEMNPGKELHLRDYLHVLRKRWPAALGVFLFFVAFQAFRVSRMTPVYMASAQILIDREKLNIISVDEILKDNRDWEYYETQYALLKSRSVAAEAIGHMERRGVLMPVALPKGGGSADEAALVEGRIASFISSITIQPVPDTRLVNIKAYDPDPEMAAAKANALAEVYIRQNIQHRLEAYKEAGLWLEEHLAETQQKLEKSALALQEYREDRNIVSLEERRGAIARKIEELNSRLSEERTRRREMEDRHRELLALLKNRDAAPTALAAAPEVAGSALVQRLEADRIRLEAELEELLKDYTDKHPKVVKVRSQIEALDGRIIEEAERVVAGISREAEQSRRREAAVPGLITEQEDLMHELERESGGYLALEKEVEENRRLYERLKARAKEANLAAGMETNNIRMVDEARAPRRPVLPNRTRAMGLALLVGLMGGAGLVFFLEYLDNTVKDPDELERATKATFLGMIPFLEPKKDDDRARDLITYLEPKSSFAEAYRALRTAVHFASFETPLRVLMVTSPGPQEGKTVTAVNLAVAVAASGKRVLLVDADMRKPRVHKVFGMKNKEGLSTLLGGENDVARVIQKSQVPNLSVIPSGISPPNPSELLGSQRMMKLLALLGERFDIVIVDSTPLVAVTDALVLSQGAEGIIMVVKSGSTRRDVLRRVRKQIDESKAHLLGTVLNMVDLSKGSYYYYYPKRYYTYYGEEDGTKTRTGKGRESVLGKIRGSRK